jgi:hypothetical protein
MRRLATLAVVSCLALAPACAEASTQTTVNVSGKSTVYFAGRTSAELTPIAAFWGYTDALSHPNFWGDLGGANGGISPTAIDITSFGNLISITAEGAWSHESPPNWTGPEGKGRPEVSGSQYGIFGVSLVEAQLNSLVAVFLSNDVPDPSATLVGLLSGDDMTTPELNQAFVIGSGLGGIQVAAGATRLYLGFHDGYEWSNNSGSVTATITAIPEPASVIVWSLLGTIAITVGWLRQRKHSVRT